MISIGDSNTGNNISIGINWPTAILIGSMLLSTGTMYAKYDMAMTKVDEVSQQVQIMSTKLEQHDVVIKGLLPRLEKIDEKQDKTNDALFNISAKLGILEGKNSK